MSENSCNACGGTGRLVDCDACDNNGWVPDPDDGGTMTCPGCYGDAGESCPVCSD